MEKPCIHLDNEKRIIPQIDQKSNIDRIFDAQYEFVNSFNLLPKMEIAPLRTHQMQNPSEDPRAYFAQSEIRNALNESIEVFSELPWKSWKTYNGFVPNESNIRIEIIDIFRHVLNLGMIMGFDNDDIVASVSFGEEKSHNQNLNPMTKSLKLVPYLDDLVDRLAAYRVQLNETSGLSYDEYLSDYAGIMQIISSAWIDQGWTKQEFEEEFFKKLQTTIDRKQNGYYTTV